MARAGWRLRVRRPWVRSWAADRGTPRGAARTRASRRASRRGSPAVWSLHSPPPAANNAGTACQGGTGT
eukprot:484225-Prymnesium_polylepis.1